MNKRLRKKKHLGEFDFKGFEVEATFDPPLADVDVFLDDFIAWVEARNLGIGGGCSPTSLGQFITRHGPILRWRKGWPRCRDVSCTEEDRKQVEEWLKAHNPATYVIGPLISAWHF